MSSDKKECNSRPAEVVLEEFAEWLCHPATIGKLWKIAQTVQSTSNGKVLLETEDLLYGGIHNVLKDIRKEIEKKKYVDVDIETYVTGRFKWRVMDYYRKYAINQKNSEKIKILKDEERQNELYKHLNIRSYSSGEELPEDKKREIRNLIHILNADSLDATCRERSGIGDDSRTLHDTLPGNDRTPEVIIHERRLVLALKECIELLDQKNNRNATILLLVVEQGMNQKEVAEIFGLSEARISQLISVARKKLRDCMIKKGITSEDLPQD